MTVREAMKLELAEFIGEKQTPETHLAVGVRVTRLVQRAGVKDVRVEAGIADFRDETSIGLMWYSTETGLMLSPEQVERILAMELA